MKCPRCSGDGWDYGHACGGDEKLCQTRCPIQEQCEYCQGEGTIPDEEPQ